MADANNKFLKINAAGLQEEVVPIVTSAGAADGGKIAKTDPATGKFDISLLPSGTAVLVVTATAGEALIAGDCVNIYNDGGVKKCRKAIATDTNKTASGYVSAAYLNGATDVQIYRGGLNSNAVILGTGVYGDNVFVSDTVAGQYMSPSAPIGNVFSQIVGMFNAAGEIAFELDPPIIRKP